MHKTFLITGGVGFIGSNFVRFLYNKYPDCRIIVVDALTYAGNIENLPVDINKNSSNRLEFWYGNVRNAELMDKLIGTSDIVVHFAAETHVTRSIYDNYIFFETDVLGTQVVANAVLNHGDRIERFIHISTSEVYGTAETDFMNEDHPLKPLSPYAAAKAGADRLVYSYWATYELPAIIVRPFNNYGPWQHLEKVVPRFITSCILNEPIRVHGDGSASRDFIHASDTCQALDALINAEICKVRGKIFNVASAEHRSIKSIAQDVVNAMNCDSSLIEYVGDRPGQVFRHTGDISNMRNILNWQPSISWDMGLRQTIDWYTANKEWWQKQLWMRTVPISMKNGSKEFH